MTELLYNPELNKIIIPIFHRYKFQAIEWHEKNQSQNVDGEFEFAFVDNDILGMLSKLSDNLEIVNGDEIIQELTKQTLQFNDGEYDDIDDYDLQNVDVYTDYPKNGDEKYNSSLKGQNSFFSKKIENIRLKITDSSDQPQLFSDVQIKFKIIEKKIIVKCKANDFTDKNQNTVDYEYTFDYLIQDNKIPKKMMNFSRQFNDDFADSYDFFDNFLGYRQLIIDNDTVEQQISLFNNPLFEEYQCIYPMLILLIFQVCTNLYGNEVERMASLGAAQAGYAALAIVSTMNKIETNELTVSDQMYVASFILILVQTAEIVTISIWNFDYFKSQDAKTSLVDDQIQIASMTIQFEIFLFTLLYILYQKQKFQFKTSVAKLKHRFIIQETKNLDEVNKKQEVKDTPLKMNQRSIDLMGEEHLNFTELSFKSINYLWHISSILTSSPASSIAYSFKYLLKQDFYEQNKQFKKSIDLYEDKLIIVDQIQPIEQEYIRKFNITINNLLRLDRQWNFYYLDKISLAKDAKNQLIENKLKSQKESFIKLKDYIKLSTR